MKILEKLLSKFNGLHYRQEYLCLAMESFVPGLKVYIVRKGIIVRDITNSHVFCGYYPVIFAFSRNIIGDDHLHLVFTSNSFSENEKMNKRDVLANLFLEKIHCFEDGLLFCRAVRGNHKFISLFHRSIVELNNYLFSRKAGNVYLKGNRLKQVQIAYSLPRKICLISVGRIGLYNLFPTDLHGSLTAQYYVISLRHEGKACRQVMDSGKIVLSDMGAHAYKKVYALGKNHMQPLKDRAAFEFSQLESQQFHLPLPEHAVAYKELELIESFIEGIHRLLVFRIVNEVKLTSDLSTLSHIHNVYATWRENNGLKGNFLLR